MVSVVLMQPQMRTGDREIRLGIQGATDELLAYMTKDNGFTECQTLPPGRMFYHGESARVWVLAGQIAIMGNVEEQVAAAEALYAAIGSRPTNEASFVAS